MAEWTRTNIIPAIPGLQPLVNAVKLAGQASKQVLEPINAVLSILNPLLGFVSGDSLDTSATSPFSSESVFVHLYPTQAYEVLNFSRGRGPWVDVLERSFELSDLTCVSSPFQLNVFVFSAASVGDLISGVAPLRDLFGFTASGRDDSPKPLRRLSTAAKPRQCRSLIEDLPYLATAIDLIESETAISIPNPIAVLTRTIAAKLAAIDEKVSRIEDFLAIIEAFDLPELWHLSTSVSDVTGISNALRAATSGPNADDLVAGTAILSDIATGSTINGLLLGGG